MGWRMIPMHVERGTDPMETRWICPEGTFSATGAVTSFGKASPVTSSDVVTAIASARVDSSRVVTIRLREGSDWQQLGDDAWPQIGALIEAAGSWNVDAGAVSSGDSPDTRLAAAVDTVLAGDFGNFVASHGGAITVCGVHDGVVTVALSGACAHCTAAEWTLRMRLERDLRVAAGGDFRQLISR